MAGGLLQALIQLILAVVYVEQMRGHILLFYLLKLLLALLHHEDFVLCVRIFQGFNSDLPLLGAVVLCGASFSPFRGREREFLLLLGSWHIRLLQLPLTWLIISPNFFS